MLPTALREGDEGATVSVWKTGPLGVYLTLPREVLARSSAEGQPIEVARLPLAPTALRPDAAAVERLADRLASAERPS
jgi:thiamine pyrophosphate-dependent acetolactate synthase large subunit-like protein